MKTLLVTGAAGFIGSHLVDRLLAEGHRVIGVDNFITGKKDNLHKALSHPEFTFIEANVIDPPETYLPENLSFDLIFHLASPASPIHYQDHPIETYLVNALGTHRLLEWARKNRARMVFTSTSEIYGEPLEHPQKETYFGNVNPVGPRACYDESKRFGEMACMTFHKQFQLDTRIVRIFNTYGPRMDPHDGRVIPALVAQALHHQPVTIEGDGTQTRSFCYVADMVEYLVRMGMAEGLAGEIINLGNPDERTVLALAEAIKQLTGGEAVVTHTEGREEDISRRCPDISKATRVLDYSPRVGLEEGLRRTIDWFRSNLR
jgi:nucleoside-diphosphate-sugar epimerase